MYIGRVGNMVPTNDAHIFCCFAMSVNPGFLCKA